jgi:putative AlgH/UPF0301 family transcriptional regulator
LRDGAWWLAPVDRATVLEQPLDDRWNSVLRTLGIDPELTTFHSTGEA